MGCKTCNHPSVAKEYECTQCLVKNENFLWCVITKINGLNLADDILSLTREESLEFIRSNGDGFWNWRPNREKLTKNNKGQYWYSSKVEVFFIGEVFPIDPDFGRELTTKGRKPSKWDVEYETYPAKDLAKALLKGQQVAEEFFTKKYKEKV